MKTFVMFFAILGCLQLCAMEKTEAEQIALIAEEILNDYQQNIHKQESAFRTEVMHLYVNSEKERQLKTNNPIKAFYNEHNERILERMVDLSVDMPEEWSKQIMASVVFYYNNQSCHICNKHRWQGTSKQLRSNIVNSHLCFNCKNKKYKKHA